METIKKVVLKKEYDFSYLGSVNLTTKHKKNYNFNEMNYSLYLAPGNMSGYEVCPYRTPECTALCLNQSGRNIGGVHNEMINRARINKTKLFYEDRKFFMDWMWGS